MRLVLGLRVIFSLSMRRLIFTFLLSFLTAFSQAQVAATPQPTQTQQQPCGVTPGTVSTVPNLGAVVKPTAKTNQTIAAMRKKWSDKIGIEIPDFTSAAPKPKPPASPCPPPTAVPNTVIAPVLKLPADVTTTIRCNPLVAPPKGTTGGSTGFTLPDPHQYGVPEQANQFEADNAVPDLNAKTPCYVLKVDPKTNKYFIAQ